MNEKAAAIKDLAEQLATDEGKSYYRRQLKARTAMWRDQIADADDPEYRNSPEFERDVRGNAQQEVISDMLADLGHDDGLLADGDYSCRPLDGRRLRARDAAKIEAYLTARFTR